MEGASNIFLDLTGPGGPVTGSCSDAQFKGKIELQSFTFSVAPVPRSRTKTPNSAGAKVVAPPKSKDGDEKEESAKRTDDSLSVVKVIDVSSAALLLYYCEHLRPDAKTPEFKQAVVTYRVARGNSTLPLVVLTFKGLYLIDYKLGEITDETTQPTETVSFAYKTCTIDYTAPPRLAAAAAPPRSVTWDRGARQTK